VPFVSWRWRPNEQGRDALAEAPRRGLVGGYAPLPPQRRIRAKVSAQLVSVHGGDSRAEAMPCWSLASRAAI
jgi:hypothetical protein